MSFKLIQKLLQNLYMVIMTTDSWYLINFSQFKVKKERKIRTNECEINTITSTILTNYD